MSRNRYKEIMSCVRLDTKTTRCSRVCTDKFVAARELITSFVKIGQEEYVPEFSLTVDEELMPLKTRCQFVNFMTNQPDKNDIKVWLLVEVESKSIVTCIPYHGKPETRNRPLSVDVVLDLAQNLGQGFNITGNNSFTSVVLVEELLKRKISYLGTFRSNRRELCAEANKLLQLHSTKFLHFCSINVILVT